MKRMTAKRIDSRNVRKASSANGRRSMAIANVIAAAYQISGSNSDVL